MAYSDEIRRRAIELSSGRSARDVQRLLQREFSDEFSVPDERTIRRWRATPSMAHSEQGQVRDPSVQSSWEAHNAQLISMTKMLLDNDLGKVLEGYTSAGKHEYAVTGSIYEDFYEVTADQLAMQLEQNIQHAIREHTEWFFCACFVPHLAIEFSEEMRAAGFWSLAKEQPYKVIDTLRVLAARWLFKGNCPVCKDW